MCKLKKKKVEIASAKFKMLTSNVDKHC